MTEFAAAAALRLSSVNATGRSFGLKAGDLLLRIDGHSCDGQVKSLQARFREAPEQERALTFWRNDAEWTVLCRTAVLGRWRNAPWPEGASAESSQDGKLRNWEVMVDTNGCYDTQRRMPSLYALLVPVYLVHMRLWGALLLWIALTALCFPLGWMAGSGVQVLVSLYFWRSSPALVRADRNARGFRMWRVIAARNEAGIHQKVAKLAPELRFVHGTTRSAGPAQTAE